MSNWPVSSASGVSIVADQTKPSPLFSLKVKFKYVCIITIYSLVMSL